MNDDAGKMIRFEEGGACGAGETKRGRDEESNWGDTL